MSFLLSIWNDVTGSFPLLASSNQKKQINESDWTSDKVKQKRLTPKMEKEIKKTLFHLKIYNCEQLSY